MWGMRNNTVVYFITMKNCMKVNAVHILASPCMMVLFRCWNTVTVSSPYSPFWNDTKPKWVKTGNHCGTDSCLTCSIGLFCEWVRIIEQHCTAHYQRVGPIDFFLSGWQEMSTCDTLTLHLIGWCITPITLGGELEKSHLACMVSGVDM